MTVNLRNVPDDIHREFKVLVARKGTTIKAEIVRLMQEAVAQAGRKK